MDPQTLVEDHLIGLISADDWSTRFAAITEIGRRRAAAAVPALGRCLEDLDPDIRQAATEALRAIGNEAAVTLLSDCERIQAKLAIEDTVRTIRDTRRKPAPRLEALKQLGDLHYEGLLALCLDCAHDPEVKVQRAAIRHIATEGGLETAKLLREKLSHQDATLAGYAFLGLCRHRNAVTEGDAQKFLSHQDRNVRTAAASTLAEIGGDSAAKIVEERIRLTLPELKWDDLHTFEKKFDDLERWLTRSESYRAELHAETVENELIALFRASEKLGPDGRAYALLSRLRSELRPLSEQEKWQARVSERSERTIETALRLAADPASASGEDVFALAEFYFDAYIIPFLVQCANDRREIEFVPGKRLPGALQAGYQSSFERSWLGVGHYFAFRFRNQVPQATSIMNALCAVLARHPEGTIRWRAANVLRTLKDERALPVLQQAQRDPEQDVANEAREACEELLHCGTRFGHVFTVGDQAGVS